VAKKRKPHVWVIEYKTTTFHEWRPVIRSPAGATRRQARTYAADKQAEYDGGYFTFRVAKYVREK